MHNDAVVQGLSEVPHTSDIEHWGAFTIGTGLGNARFTNGPARLFIIHAPRKPSNTIRIFSSAE
jgi:hypothetical protein